MKASFNLDENLEGGVLMQKEVGSMDNDSLNQPWDLSALLFTKEESEMYNPPNGDRLLRGLVESEKKMVEEMKRIRRELAVQAQRYEH